MIVSKLEFYKHFIRKNTIIVIACLAMFTSTRNKVQRVYSIPEFLNTVQRVYNITEYSMQYREYAAL